MKGIGIDLLVREHDNILKFIDFMMRSSIELMNGGKIDVNIFREYIDFARNYADKHHHGKEEKILFRIMVDELGGPAEKLVRHGMLVEHDMGRLFINCLEEALNSYELEASDENRIQVIANAVAYGNHLKRHIDKENKVVYVFAQGHLSEELLDKLDEETIAFERDFKEEADFYSNWIEKMYERGE